MKKRSIIPFAMMVICLITFQSIGHAEEHDDKFSILWISDTQSVVYYDPQATYTSNVSALESMGDWVEDNIGTYNIIQAVQTGDAVDNGYHPWQWRRYYQFTDKFTDEIPYTAVAGNHELGVKLQEWDAYLALPEVKAIPEERKFEEGKAMYSILEYGNEKFIIAGIGYGAEEESFDWLNNVLEDHSEYKAILLFHSYLRNANEYMPIGNKIFEEVVKANPNVVLVLSGHVSKGGNAFRQEQIDDNGDGVADRTVTAMMYNYQSWTPNCGQLRILTFDCSNRSIEVYTYSPYTKKEYKDIYFDSARFTINNAF